ncbi:MAG: M28 family peptidase [Bdellovibrionales bacterium]|nr:M28 family peptidase [Bdellovibrionales bacterium]
MPSRKVNLAIQAAVSAALVAGGLIYGTPPGCKDRKVLGEGFSPSRVKELVEAQVAFGPRVPGTSAHQKTKDWISAQIQELGPIAEVQEFTANYGFEVPGGQVDRRPMKAWNIQASLFPEKKIRVLLAAHWDTRFAADKDKKDYRSPGPGALDGASGVAFLLELGRALLAMKTPPELGVDLLFLDAEDQGGSAMSGLTPWCLGSQAWAKRFRDLGMPVRYRYGILFDMVGAKDAQYPREVYSLTYGPATLAKIWAVSRELGYAKYFPNADAMAVTDDHVAINQIAGIAMVDLIDLRPTQVSGETVSGWDFPPYHHTHGDVPDLLDLKTIQALGETVMTVILRDR